MLEEYPRKIILSDSTECFFRVASSSDRDLIAGFFSRVSPDDLWAMKRDYTSGEAVDFYLQCLNPAENFILLALVGEAVVGIGSLHFSPFGARRHIGDIEIVIVDEYKKRRLGTWLLLDLAAVAAEKGLEILKIELMAGKDDAAIVSAKRVNFIPQATLTNYLQDRSGRWADIVILVKEIRETWSEY